MARVRSGVLHQLVVGLIFLSLYSSMGICFGQSDPGFQSEAERADALRESGRLDEAIQAYRAALALNPDWKEGLWYLGTLLYDRDRPAEASQSFDRLAQLSPRDGRIRAFLGLCRFQTREYERALEDLTAALDWGIAGLSNLAPVVRYHTGLLLTRAGRFEEAFEALRPFAPSAGTRDELLLAFGLWVLRDRLLPAEIPAARIPLTRMAGLAGAAAAASDWDEAEMRFRALAAAYPDEPDLHCSWGQARVARTRTDPSAPDPLPLFREELERSPGHLRTLIEISSLEAQRGLQSEARSTAIAALGKAADSPEALASVAAVLLRLEAFPEAEEALKKAVTLSPGELEYLGLLSQLYLKTGRPEAIAGLFSDFTRIEEEGFPVNRVPGALPADQVQIDDDELVIGVTVNGETRAYPVKYMNGPSNELLNDTLGRQPIAATW